MALGQLWGFLKYHHPIVAEGKLDWDAELIKIIPTIMNAKNENEWKNSLDNWIVRCKWWATQRRIATVSQ